ncbi:Aste57867_19089 [Aphanomyces stellatus]|uniref:Aste57867_19089 protein n=1 Tax=Aphanomyces stellatus TaxID=120398 RepID=A0A485LG06_9STRA|nr:hypothetical protein As57867_019025 [Aphanomyces stellatus]VFT95814.1 Aste57867_19089 [Aphanomyces stellatus]
MLTGNIRRAFHERLSRSKWMDETTRTAAVAKLTYMTQLLGYGVLPYVDQLHIDRSYPSTRREYPVVLHSNDYFGNLQTLAEMEHVRAVGKMGGPVDKSEWGMSAHTVNAYYNPSFNQIVFPAGILQPPFFDATKDPAVNYGGIGMVIGHEITHGFDDQGRNFDGDGKLRPWWSKATTAAFKTRAQCMSDQFSAMHVWGSTNQVLGAVNGPLTLGETIADSGGLAVAFEAFVLHLADSKSRTRTPARAQEQLFFLSFAQSWCQKSTDQRLQIALDDVHPPTKQRVNGAVMNNADFARVFSCPAATPMNPTAKCTVW